MSQLCCINIGFNIRCIKNLRFINLMVHDNYPVAFTLNFQFLERTKLIYWIKFIIWYYCRIPLFCLAELISLPMLTSSIFLYTYIQIETSRNRTTLNGQRTHPSTAEVSLGHSNKKILEIVDNLPSTFINPRLKRITEF